MRLTERKVCYPKCDQKGNLTKVDYIEIKDKKLAEEKLCQLEDIEEELGIDLTTLFKALKNGIYYIDEHIQIKIIFSDDNRLYITNNAIMVYATKTWLEFKDYGKTWALTKEELE